MTPRDQLGRGDIYAVMAWIGYTEAFNGPSGLLYHSLAHGPKAEYFMVSCDENATIDADDLIRSLEFVGVPIAVVIDAIAQLG